MGHVRQRAEEQVIEAAKHWQDVTGVFYTLQQAADVI
jgi:hypothetical protein